MFARFTFRTITLVVASLLTAVIGLGLAYQRHSQASSEYSIVEGLPRDGWISKQAVVTLPRLLTRGNRLALEFHPIRPMVPDAKLRISVCGAPAEEHMVGAGTQLVFSLQGECEPRSVTIEVLNTFRGSMTDPRELGAQLQRIRITSRLGLPLVRADIILQVTLLILLLGMLLPRALYRSPPWWSGLCAVALTAYPLSRADPSNLVKPLWLCVTLLCLVMGYMAAQDSSQAPEPSTKRIAKSDPWHLILLGIICVAGAVFRFYGLHFGLPHTYHPDEIPKVNAIMRMVATRSLNPHYFLHPSLLLYFTYAVNTIFHVCGMEGEFRASAFLAGRTVSAVAGTLSIPLVYLLGRRLLNSSSALLAAALLAFFPLHITCSRYLKEDVLLTCFILAAAWLVVKAAQDGQRALLLLAAVLVGLAASTKYSGILAAGLIISAPWVRSRHWRPDGEFTWYAAAALLIVPIVFLCASPYVVLDHAKFISDFSYEREHALRGHTGAVDAWSQFWMYHITRSIVPGTGTLTTIAALLGVGILLWRRRIEDLCIVGLLLAFYLPAEWVKSKPEPQPERYIFPCLPFLALAAAVSLEYFTRNASRGLKLLASVAIVAFPLWRSLQLARDLITDTRVVAAQWMERNAPPHSRVLLDWAPYGPALPSSQFTTDYMLRKNLLKRLSVSGLRSSENDYIIFSSLFYDRYFSQPGNPRIFKNRYRQVFANLPIIAEFSAPSGTYGFHNPRLTVFSLRADDIASLDQELLAKANKQIQATQNEQRSGFFSGE